MKIYIRAFLIVIVVLFGFVGAGHATLFTFSGEANSGIGSATMDISITDNNLTITLDNTSPTTLTTGTGTNTPGITGFGFNLSNSPTLSSWSLNAYNTSAVLTTIGGSGTSTGNWVLRTTADGVTLDYLPSTDQGSKGALYNPAASDGFGGTPQYFTTATLVISFTSAPVLATMPEDLGSGLSGIAYVRMQNVGEDGEGSLKLTQVPEPTTLLLIGFGLVGLAGFRKKFRR